MEQTFDSFRERQRNIISKMVADLEPDGDIMPMLICDDVLVAIPELGGPMKDQLATVVIPAFIKQLHTRYGALVMTAWTTSVPQDAGEATKAAALFIPPSKSPDRREAIIISFFSRKTEVIDIGYLTRRDGSAPTIEWEPTADSYEGRFAHYSKLCVAYGINTAGEVE